MASTIRQELSLPKPDLSSYDGNPLEFGVSCDHLKTTLRRIRQMRVKGRPFYSSIVLALQRRHQELCHHGSHVGVPNGEESS